MGIPGLTTYIAKRSEQYLEPFDLHDTYVVIDGYSIACQLYIFYTKSNCAFGGDYDKYAQCVKKFFESLFKCNITPLVILDGAVEHKKVHTLIKRLQDKIQTAESYTPLCQSKLKFLPALLTYTFISVIKEMNIRHVQCLFEADNEIAAIAKFLNCPVLSYDSDFYIYGVLYIPFNTLDTGITRKLQVNVKCCKIYRVKYLLNTFPGLDESMLPLVAILLGNDYIEQNVFKHFYQYIKLPKVGHSLHNVQQCRIEATFRWLSKCTLPTAISMMMNKVPYTNKKTVLKLMKIIIDQYTNVSTNTLNPLGLSKEEIAIAVQNSKNNSKTNENHLKIINELAEELRITHIDKSKSNTETAAVIDSLPTWYIDEHCKVLLPSYFMDLLLSHLCICSVQVEDFRQPSSIFICEKILNVIFTLLTLGFKKNIDSANYLTRGENKRVTHYPLKYVDNIFPFKIPLLHNLRNISLSIRKEIFDITLGIKEQINEFPVNWRLYIAAVTYWVDNLTNVRSHSHIYAFLFAMIHHVIDAKIGYYRSIHKFQAKYKEKLVTLESKKQTEPNNLLSYTGMSIMQALDAVEIDDCILLAPFFINNSEIDQKLYTNPKKFQISVVHLFALFQNCVKYSLHLNALLGFPYEATSVYKMYNSTLLYNLSNNFDKRNNIENYINLILKCSPTLLQLFNTILIETKQMFKICATK